MGVSVYILAPFVAWVVAQTVKYAVQALKTGNVHDISYLYSSGNMPSAHSALMISLAVVVGAREGLGSALFGTVVVIAGIILYDAMNVRRAVGEQGRSLEVLLKDAKQTDLPYRAQGHTLADVLVGSFIGVVSALCVLSFL